MRHFVVKRADQRADLQKGIGELELGVLWEAAEGDEEEEVEPR